MNILNYINKNNHNVCFTHCFFILILIFYRIYNLLFFSFYQLEADEFSSSYLSSAGCLAVYATDKLSPILYLQLEITRGIPSDGSTIQSLSFFSIIDTCSVIALLNKFFADEPNNANTITTPVTIKIIANFHSEMF